MNHKSFISHKANRKDKLSAMRILKKDLMMFQDVDQKLYQQLVELLLEDDLLPRFIIRLPLSPIRYHLQLKTVILWSLQVPNIQNGRYTVLRGIIVLSKS